ncbi:MAG: WG repeat-containing protein [Clostridium sp.]|nr:WG repeat-containing protein [Clostridium sp.]
MKKSLVLIGLILLLTQTGSFAQTQNKPPLKMSDVTVFSEKNNFGLKDNKGNVIVDAKYKKLIRVGDSAWIVQKKNRFGLMDTSGQFLVKPKYRHVERVFGKYVKLGNDNDYGLYDEKGNAIIKPEYSSIEPLFGKMFLTCKKYKYGIVDETGKILLKNEFDDIYMPNPHALRIRYEGEWYEIEKMTKDDITLPEGVKKVVIDEKEFKVTHLAANTGLISGYSAITATDYILKIFSSISPAYEETIDDLMLSQGADVATIFVKLGWIPRFPFTYAKKYYSNFVNPNSGPLSDVKNEIKRQIK